MTSKENKKTQPKTLSPAMERLVGAMSNQGIWGSRRQQGLQQMEQVNKGISECEANLNRINGEITATVNGIIDNNPKLIMDDILKEAGAIVDANAKAKQQQQKPPNKNIGK